MRQINDAHVAKPGLAVVEVAAADDETAFAVQELLAARWGIAPADRTPREPAYGCAASWTCARNPNGAPGGRACPGDRLTCRGRRQRQHGRKFTSHPTTGPTKTGPAMASHPGGR
ncbi:DUF6207 family protein [Streptomyces sp. V1I6]|uniref:DUF6207 family protein n=1 Tax=Streptomyces sp. V1I6 TaxID=3042273 RepID=UPI0027D869BC|nr:DUF6207 family protein [Streptomyces sp. V1I6]